MADRIFRNAYFLYIGGARFKLDSDHEALDSTGRIEEVPVMTVEALAPALNSLKPLTKDEIDCVHSAFFVHGADLATMDMARKLLAG